MSAQDPREVLQAAAAAAASMLPDLFRQREALDDQISRLETLINAVGTLPVAVPQDRPQESVEPGADKFAKMEAEIDKILEEQGPMKGGDLFRLVESRLGAPYGMSTVYRRLTAGQKKGKYINEKRLWSLNPSRDLV